MKLSKKHIAFIGALFVFCLLMIFILPVFLDKTPNKPDQFDEITEIDYTPETIIYEDTVSDPITDNMPGGTSYRCINTRTVLDTKTASRVSLCYPEFLGFGDDSVDDQLNALVKTYNEQMQRYYGQGLYKMINYGIKVVYELESFTVTYADESFISIVFFGVFSTISENDPIDTGSQTFAYSLNIDVKNSAVITSEQILSDFGALKNTFFEGKMHLENGQSGLLDNTTYYDMFYQYSDIYKIYPMFYFSKDKLMMIITLTSDLGGRAVFSNNLSESKDFISFDANALKGLFSSVG